MSKLPFLTAVPPRATKIFLLASISREFMCQCPMVTPASLGGYACARAVPATRLNISDKAAIRLVIGALLFVLGIRCEPITPAGQAEATPALRRCLSLKGT